LIIHKEETMSIKDKLNNTTGIQRLFLVCLFVLFGNNLSFASDKTSWHELSPSQLSKNFIQLPVSDKNRSAKLVQVSLMQDFFVSQNGAKSMIAVNEFDCANNRVRVLRLAVYLQSMGNGLIADFATPAKNREWEQIPKESFANEAIKIACQG
jgi:hypothetical protein